MARSRRSYRRSTSQRAVSLLASALPAPIQRIADTQFGSSLLMLGIPALVVAGILHLDWNGGLPQLTIDRNRAQEIRNAAREEFGRISSPETVQTIQQWERSAVDLWNATQGQRQGDYPSQPYSNNLSYPASSPQASSGYDYRSVSQQQPLPSSSAAQYVSTQTTPRATVPSNSYPNSSSYYQEPVSPSSNYQQPQQPYNQQSQQSYSQQQPQQSYYQQPQPQNPWRQ